MTHECWYKRILWLDLTTRTTRIESLPLEIYENFIGGKGLGTYLLYKHLPAGINPLSEGNILFFLTGPLQGLPAPNVGRWTLVTKSPLSGLIIDSHCGGALGREIKNSGYDVIAVTGKASASVYIRIEDDDVTIESAADLWGRGSYETTQILSERHKGASVYTIGPAGENLVRIATGCCELAHQTGRGGCGAVLGSKNLKAVVAKGSKKLDVPGLSKIRKINSDIIEVWNKKDNIDFKRYGSPFLVEISNELGQFPTRNYQSGYFEEYEKITPESLHGKYVGANHSCPHCIMRCTHGYSTFHPNSPEQTIESCIEYETIGLMGGNLGISDSDYLLQLNYLADDLGIDTISGGATIAFAMEAFEKGIISESDLGFALQFGEGKAALRFLEMIARREGVGDILAEGTRRAAEKLGADTEEFAVHFKGLELPAWDPRGRRGLALSYATADVGGSHLRGWPTTTDPTDKSAVYLVESMLDSRDHKTLTDSLEVCHFTYHLPLSLEQKIQLLNAATGLDYTQETVKLFARRVATLARMFNHREGISRASDILPPRMWEGETTGPRKGMSAFHTIEDFDACLDKFYELRGYNLEDGLPTTETLKLLGLSDIV